MLEAPHLLLSAILRLSQATCKEMKKVSSKVHGPMIVCISVVGLLINVCTFGIPTPERLFRNSEDIPVLLIKSICALSITKIILSPPVMIPTSLSVNCQIFSYDLFCSYLMGYLLSIDLEIFYCKVIKM